ncbi:MAG: TonB-dependent receptor, partial [Opitutales bacterium]
MKRLKRSIIATCIASIASPFAFAQDTNVSDGIEVLEPFEVIGSKQNALKLEGSGSYLDNNDLGTFLYTDINEILRQVPGVYVRGEEGYGLFPNISLRGVDPNRSAKVTILEDGIPSSPSPFSDPSAYYSPTAGRMAGFEILKGSSQLKFGPNTTGGVINYISTSIPQKNSSHLQLSYGEYNECISHAYVGGKTPLGNGTFGYLVEVFDHRTDGWKIVDGIGNAPGADSPVAKTDVMLKLSYEFSGTDYLELKIGRTDLGADVGYMGVTKTDFDTGNPYRRYVGGGYDNMDSDQTRYYLRYLKELSPEMNLSTTVFQNEFNRDWYKAKYSSFASDAVLKGTADGTFQVKHNDRTYEVWGIQSNLEWERDNHLLDSGFRYTDDVYTTNAQTTDTYTVVANTSVSGPVAGTPSNPAERSSEAIELYITDEISVSDQLTVTPGIRYTDVDYVRTTTGSRDDVLLGVGATYVFSETLAGFGGVYQGHALPGASGGASGLNIEESLGLEIGLRGSLMEDVVFEIAYFRTDYTDMLALESLASNVTNSANVGESLVQG